MLSKPYVGVVLIALVCSTELTAFLFGERAKDPIVIMKNEAPALDPRSDKVFDYDFSVMARRDLERVKIKFTWFRPCDIPPLPSAEEGASAYRMLASAPKVASLRNFSRTFGIQPERVEVPAWKGGGRAILLDYSDVLRLGMKDQSPLVEAAYLFVVENGSISQYYQGVPDFFPESDAFRAWPTGRDPRRWSTIELGVDENVTKYVPRDLALNDRDALTLGQLPAYGVATFNHIKKDQIVRVTSHIQGASLARIQHQFEMIRVYVDGELNLVLVNDPHPQP